MRIRNKKQFKITSGNLIIADPGFIFPGLDREPYVFIPENAVLMDKFGGDGNFKVYKSNEAVVVDTAPRLFKATKRTNFQKLDNSVGVDSGLICFIDSRKEDLTSIETFEEFYVSLEVPNGNYFVWREENETSVSHRNSILSFGTTEKLYLSGKDANTIEAIEKEMVSYFRSKGQVKEKIFKELEAKVLHLHWAKSKDPRLSKIALTLNINLPKRIKKNRT